MTGERARYQTSLEDSARWDGLELRSDDIVISAPSKSGTTWTQMICALLVFQTPDLPAPLTTLSPWMDMKIRPLDEVLAQLDGQQHRRFIKTHTPLDGLPRRAGVTYVAVGRDPRDVVVSLHHQHENLDRAAIQRLLGEPRSGTACDAVCGTTRRAGDVSRLDGQRRVAVREPGLAARRRVAAGHRLVTAPPS